MPEREGQQGQAGRRRAPGAAGKAEVEAAAELGRPGRGEQVTGRAGYRPEQFGADAEYGTLGEAGGTGPRGEAGAEALGAGAGAKGRGAVTARAGEAAYGGYTGDVARGGSRIPEATTGLRAEATPGTFAGACEGAARGTATGWGGVTGAPDLEAGAEYDTSLMDYEGRTNAGAYRSGQEAAEAWRAGRQETEVAAEPGTAAGRAGERKPQKERR